MAAIHTTRNTAQQTRDAQQEQLAHLVEGRLCGDQALAVSPGVLFLLGLDGREFLGARFDLLPESTVGGPSRLKCLMIYVSFGKLAAQPRMPSG